MAKLSPEERAELEARLAADDDADDDADESELTVGGVTFRGTMKRIRDFAAANGVKLVPDPPAAKTDAKGKAKDSGDTDVIRRFRTGRTG